MNKAASELRELALAYLANAEKNKPGNPRLVDIANEALEVADREINGVEKMNNKPWTLKDERRLVQLYSEGFSGPEIAGLLERTPGAIYARTKEIRDFYAPLFQRAKVAASADSAPAVQAMPKTTGNAPTSRDRYFGATLFGVLCALSGAALAAGLM